MAKELWIGVDDMGTAMLYEIEPTYEDGYYCLPIPGDAVFLDHLAANLFGIPPGHKAKLVLDEASVTKGGE